MTFCPARDAACWMRPVMRHARSKKDNARAPSRASQEGQRPASTHHENSFTMKQFSIRMRSGGSTCRRTSPLNPGSIQRLSVNKLLNSASAYRLPTFFDRSRMDSFR